jgi:hypothetical protein
MAAIGCTSDDIEHKLKHNSSMAVVENTMAINPNYISSTVNMFNS